jgi:hypothetical protein
MAARTRHRSRIRSVLCAGLLCFLIVTALAGCTTAAPNLETPEVTFPAPSATAAG